MKFENRTFLNQTIDLDNNEFVGCRFDNCNLVYHGGKPPSLVNCSFGNPHIGFVDAAGATLSFITSLYHGGFKPIIEATINNIRSNPKKTDWNVN